MEEIRPIRPDEFEQLVYVSASAFLQPNAATDPYSDWRRWLSSDPRFSLERTLGVFVDGTLRASVANIEREVWIGDTRLMLAGIAHVATLPWERRKGYAGRLLVAHCKAMCEMGYPISALGPFSYRYYRKYGWEVGEDLHILGLAPLELRHGNTFSIPPFAEISNVRVMDKNNSDDLYGVMQVYANWTRGKNLRHIRNERDWRESILYDEGATPQGGKRVIALYAESDGHIQGYVMYSIDAVSGDTWGGVMHIPRGLKLLKIHEMMGLTPAALRGLAAYVGSLISDDQSMLKLQLIAPLEDLQASFLVTPGAEMRIRPGMMVRVVDIPAAFTALSTPPNLRVRFALDVQEIEGMPSGTYLVDVEDGHVIAKQTEVPSRIRRLRCDIQTLSQMYFGYVPPTYLHSIGKLEMDSTETLNLADALFPERQPFLYGVDHF